MSQREVSKLEQSLNFIVLETEGEYAQIGRPPMPKPRQRRINSETEAIRSHSSSLPPYPAPYAPPVPFPIISGYLEKSTSDPASSTKSQTWVKRFVEVSEGTFRYFNNREEKEDTGVVVPLAASFVSVQAKKHIRLESKSGVRVFRASNESRAHQWLFVISRYCLTAPVAEGFCKKLSGSKNILEERYIRISADGILSWFKSENDSDPRGSLQIRGEGLMINPDEESEVWLQTGERRYEFRFSDSFEADEWMTILCYHSKRQPMENTAISVRNKMKK